MDNLCDILWPTSLNQSDLTLLTVQRSLRYNLDKEEVVIRKTAYAIQVIHVCSPYVFWPETMPFNCKICCISRADITLSWQLNEAYLGDENGRV